MALQELLMSMPMEERAGWQQALAVPDSQPAVLVQNGASLRSRRFSSTTHGSDSYVFSPGKPKELRPGSLGQATDAVSQSGCSSATIATIEDPLSGDSSTTASSPLSSVPSDIDGFDGDFKALNLSPTQSKETTHESGAVLRGHDSSVRETEPVHIETASVVRQSQPGNHQKAKPSAANCRTPSNRAKRNAQALTPTENRTSMNGALMTPPDSLRSERDHAVEQLPGTLILDAGMSPVDKVPRLPTPERSARDERGSTLPTSTQTAHLDRPIEEPLLQEFGSSPDTTEGPTTRTSWKTALTQTGIKKGGRRSSTKRPASGEVIENGLAPPPAVRRSTRERKQASRSSDGLIPLDQLNAFLDELAEPPQPPLKRIRLSSPEEIESVTAQVPTGKEGKAKRKRASRSSLPPLVIRRPDGRFMRLVCTDCQQTNFADLRGLFFHCRWVHRRAYPNFTAARDACGQVVDDDEEAAAYVHQPISGTVSVTSNVPLLTTGPDAALASEEQQGSAVTSSRTKVPRLDSLMHKRLSASSRSTGTAKRKPSHSVAKAPAEVQSRSNEDAEQMTVVPQTAVRDQEPPLDLDLLDLARGFTLESPVGEKPNPVGQPVVWADGRQALCETLPYFRSFHGGGYCSGGFAHGFMFDKEAHPRDFMDSNVVISRAGGGLSKDKATESMVMEKDQTENSQVKSVRNSINQLNPIVIITGDSNPKMPCKVPHPYCVLDWFKPTHIWYEKSKGKTIIRYRFEKLRPETESWWTPEGEENPIALGTLAPPYSERCSRCQKESSQIYVQGWTCLEPECTSFWKLHTGNEPSEADLQYDPRFLKQHVPWPLSDAPHDLKPDLMKLSSTPMMGQDVSWTAWKGFVCPDCGRCSSREAWAGWVCGNENCSRTYTLPRLAIPSDALHDFYYPLSSAYAFSRDICLPSINVRATFTHNYRMNIFVIPGIEGFVAHFIANKTVNEESGGPNDMWKELQEKDIGLRRRPLATAMLRGTLLTQHFLVNYGMPYKFIAATSTRSFDDACDAVKATRSRLNWASKYLTKGEHLEFNEVLALGYFEKQAIDYHDDGENGLGPTIATLSLGYPATMRLRMKAKHYNGISKSEAYVDRRPIPGCREYEKRKAAHEALQNITDSETRRAKLKALPQELELTKRTGNAKDAMSIHLGHGDIVIMHGVGIQEYYEHAVEPTGKLRFALTCRYIDPESLKPEDKPTYVVGPDEGTYDGAALAAAT